MLNAWISWYRHLPIRLKMGFGYTLALGVAMGGTAIGVLVGQVYEQRAEQTLDKAQLEKLYVQELQTNALALAIHEQILMNSLGSPEEFLRQVEQLEQRSNAAQLAGQKLMSAPWIETDSDLMILLDLHQNTIEIYSELLADFIDNLPVYSSTDAERMQAQADFFAFTNTIPSRRLYAFLQRLDPLSVNASMQYDQAKAAATQARQLRNQIIIASFALSILLALMLVTYLNRLVSRPLQQLTKVSREITQDHDFNRTILFSSRDEIGQLAKSFNQLIAKVNELLIEQQRQQDAQLVQQEKMASLGRMVAGVAHEINNPVNFIYGNLGYAERYFQDLCAIADYCETISDPAFRPVQRILDEIDYEFLKVDLPKLIGSMRFGAERSRQIVLSLKNFSRLDDSVPQSIRLHELIDSTLLILNNRIKQGIQVEKHYGVIPEIEGYPGALYQVLMNLLTNAIEALDEGGEQSSHPTITIATSAVNAGRIQLSIQDNGPGIPAEIRDRVFEQFFTTKGNAGTGLGLAITHHIVVEKHHGTITCRSVLNQGTTFVMTLPIRQERSPVGEAVAMAQPELQKAR